MLTILSRIKLDRDGHLLFGEQSTTAWFTSKVCQFRKMKMNRKFLWFVFDHKIITLYLANATFRKGNWLGFFCSMWSLRGVQIALFQIIEPGVILSSYRVAFSGYDYLHRNKFRGQKKFRALRISSKLCKWRRRTVQYWNCLHYTNTHSRFRVGLLSNLTIWF